MFEMFKKKKEDPLKSLKESSEGKIIIACKEELREELEKRLTIKYVWDKEVVFLVDYTDKDMFDFWLNVMNKRKGHEFYNIQDKSEEYIDDELDNEKLKNRLDMFATANIYSNDIGEIMAQIDEARKELGLENEYMK